MCLLFFLRIRLPPRSTRTDTLFPYTTLFRSHCASDAPPMAGRFHFSFRVASQESPDVRPAHPGRTRRFRPGHCSHIRPSSLRTGTRSEEHTSELQSLMRISYAVFCLKKKKNHKHTHQYTKTKNTSQIIR